MAAPTCTFCGEYQAVFMGTSMEDGDTFCACGFCMAGAMLGMTVAVVSGMTPEEAQTHAEAFSAILAVYTPPAPSKPSRKRSGPSAAKGDEPTDDTGGSIPGGTPLLALCPECGGMAEVGELEEVQCPDCKTLFDPRTPIAE